MGSLKLIKRLLLMWKCSLFNLIIINIIKLKWIKYTNIWGYKINIY